MFKLAGKKRNWERGSGSGILLSTSKESCLSFCIKKIKEHFVILQLPSLLSDKFKVCFL